ncbi:MAG TPA: sugar ABC transporter substrate-binding protein [Fimbriimonas sp.]|nr:sugar ABC transporter substrate-binding protein [Fimbriimonas sp.]
MAWGNPEQMALEEKLCEQFNEQNPDISVKFFRVPGSAYLNKAIVMFASRTAPDVVRIDHYNFPNLVRKNYFLDLTALTAKDKDFRESDFFPQTINEARWKGGFYGLNVMFGGEIMYYNKSLMKSAGLADPYELAKKGEWTYDRMLQHAIALTKFGPDGRGKQFGIAVPTFPMNVPTIWAFGGEILNEDKTKSLLDLPGSIKAYQFLTDLRWKYKCAPTPAQAAQSAFSFESGKLGMEFGWMGSAPRYNSAIKSFDWDICPIPIGPSGNTSMIKGNQLVIYRETKYPEASWRFIRFLTSSSTEKLLYVDNRRNFPTRKSVAYSKEFLNPKVRPFQTDVFLQGVEGARELPINHRWGEWTQILNSEQDNLYSGRERDAGVVMRRAAAQINEVLADEEGF